MTEFANTGHHLSPGNQDDDECIRLCIQFLIYPGEIPHQQVTSMLGVLPTTAHNRGDQVTNSLGRTRTCRLTLWELSSEDEVAIRDVRRHLDWLVERIRPGEEGLRRLQAESGVRMGITCRWWTKTDQALPRLWPEQMYWLSRLNQQLEINAQFWGDDEEDDQAS